MTDEKHSKTNAGSLVSGDGGMRGTDTLKLRKQTGRKQDLGKDKQHASELSDFNWARLLQAGCRGAGKRSTMLQGSTIWCTERVT